MDAARTGDCMDRKADLVSLHLFFRVSLLRRMPFLELNCFSSTESVSLADHVRAVAVDLGGKV